MVTEMDIFPKFIIETDDELGDCLILSKCTYHRDLVTFPDKVKGGGWFEFNVADNMFIFSRESEEFGEAEMEDIKYCVDNNKIFTSPCLEYPIGEEHIFAYRDYQHKLHIFCK
jgi:hypothetical protein